jgi:hypothetical protein
VLFRLYKCWVLNEISNPFKKFTKTPSVWIVFQQGFYDKVFRKLTTNSILMNVQLLE